MNFKIFVLFLFCSLPFYTQATPPQNDPLCLNVHNIPVCSILSWMAEYANKNIVLSSSVHGTLTLNLQDISWQHALNAICQTQKLICKNIENILYISHSDENHSKQNQQSVQTLWKQFKNAKAEDAYKLLKTQTKNLLSADGNISVDPRTNSIIVLDHAEQLKTINTIIQKLDMPLPQILIEARIVNIDDDYEKELGIQFDMTNNSTHDSSQTVSKNTIAKIDLPALANQAGRIGIVPIKLNQTTLLDLELSALESAGRAEIISKPRLLTNNQQTAFIEAGEEIPYQESVSQGVTTTSFKKAVLSLQITPQIISDHKIILHLKVNQDKRSNKEILGVPAIDTRQLSTHVIVHDGQTIVLGGIYEHTLTKSTERIPFLSDLPKIGVLFNHKKTINNRRELLIFVTPKIIA